MGERVVRTVEIVGLIPTSSTEELRLWGFLYCLLQDCVTFGPIGQFASTIVSFKTAHS